MNSNITISTGLPVIVMLHLVSAMNITVNSKIKRYNTLTLSLAMEDIVDDIL